MYLVLIIILPSAHAILIISPWRKDTRTTHTVRADLHARATTTSAKHDVMARRSAMMRLLAKTTDATDKSRGHEHKHPSHP